MYLSNIVVLGLKLIKYNLMANLEEPKNRKLLDDLIIYMNHLKLNELVKNIKKENNNIN